MAKTCDLRVASVVAGGCVLLWATGCLQTRYFDDVTEERGTDTDSGTDGSAPCPDSLAERLGLFEVAVDEDVHYLQPGDNLIPVAARVILERQPDGRPTVAWLNAAMDTVHVEGSEEALAATAAELLGTAYLFEADKTERSQPIKELVETTREQAGVQAARPTLWHLSIAASGRGAFTGRVGPNLYIGGFVGAERVLRDFFLAFGVGVTGGPLGHEAGSAIRGYEVHAKVDGFWGPRWGRVRLGPLLSIFGGPESVIIERPGFPRDIYAHWAFHGGIGMTLRARLPEKVSLMSSLGISATPTRLEVRLRSTEELVFRDGIVSMWVSLGALFF